VGNALLDLVQREEARIHRGLDDIDADAVLGLPVQRAGDQHLPVGRALALRVPLRLGGLGHQVVGVTLDAGEDVRDVGRRHDLRGVLVMERLAELGRSHMAGRRHVAERRGVAELAAGVHVALVVVLDDDHPVVAQRGPDRGAHADVHPAVAGDHHERDVLADG
jgi:hypothetical protein